MLLVEAQLQIEKVNELGAFTLVTFELRVLVLHVLAPQLLRHSSLAAGIWQLTSCNSLGLGFAIACFRRSGKKDTGVLVARRRHSVCEQSWDWELE